MTANVCDSCYQAYMDESGDDDLESAAEFLAWMGAEIPAHNCDTWRFQRRPERAIAIVWQGGEPCVCACHPQIGSAAE